MGSAAFLRAKKKPRGCAKAYVTRAKALRQLNISLADFRKLCILKGVYPRVPKKKFAGADKTYYNAKDIQWMQHEPVLQHFNDTKKRLKKYKRLVCRHELEAAKKKEERKPQLEIDHLVQERYPSFDDALRDLDDPVSMLALFCASRRRSIA